MIGEGLKHWKMVFVMSVRKSEMEDAEKFRKKYNMQSMEILINPTNEKIWDEYENAQIYWHASGFGEDITLHPDRAEHFGISTVEAMGAGAVPIVYPVGGQKEIIKDGENGFTFYSKEELKKKTLSLVEDSKKRKDVARKSAESAGQYSEKLFANQILQIIQ